jgi:hypothetical protein
MSVNDKPDLRVKEFTITYEQKKAIEMVERMTPNGIYKEPVVVDVPGEFNEIEWCEFFRVGNANFSTIKDKVSRLQKDSIIWPSLAQYYEAWKKGQELPAVGTPLGIWPGVNQAQASALKTFGIRTVEEVASMEEGVMNRVPLPGMRSLRENAKRFLEARDSTRVEEELAKRDAKIEVLTAQLENLAIQFSEQQEPARRKPGRPPKDEAAA